jgi:acetyl esterase/lipase
VTGMALRTRVLCALAAARPGPPVADLTPERLRRNRAAVLPHGFPFSTVFGAVPASVSITTRDATTRDGQVPVRVYRPTRAAASAPLVMFFHGGGWVQGNVRSYDPLCAQVAARVGAVVVSVDYRLAPEHVFPAAVHDAYDWALGHAVELDIDPRRVAVMGDSAGGNLAAVVALMARDLPDGPAIAAQVLIYPATDATLTAESLQRNAHAPILTRADVHGFLGHYRGTAEVTDPLLSPLHAPSHAGLPPALVQTAELDPLRDDGLRYAEALRGAGVPVRYTEYVGVPHGFASFPGAVLCGEQALAEVADALSGALS